MGLHPIQKIRSLPKAVKWMVAILAFLFVLSNLYHWYKVWGLPLFYFIPEHSFKVVDAGTGEPIEGVAAVEIYEMSPIYDTSEGFMFVLPILDPWLQLVKRSNYTSSLRVCIREGVSDKDGLVEIPPIGPIRRRRVFAFNNNNPYMIIYKTDYIPKYIYNDFQFPANSQPFKFVPSWSSGIYSIDAFYNINDEGTKCDKYLKSIKVAKMHIYENNHHTFRNKKAYILHNAKHFHSMINSSIENTKKGCVKK
ncbi:MAG TPA: hypothetical protein PK014_14610 [Thermoanaerobaculia bacterium]|nr:hypothetical protein [Thermoanaerobaculia bacterium]HUM31279.1 hypothetical protein [Thermoanaerobaculia bacterium]HXK69633.1 hypothetical protein [Thermoanaerobaculia bacterium]